jgi:hypothetical protein
LAEATARLWNIATKGITTADLTMGWRLNSLKPGPLKSLQDYEIAAAAAGQTNAGAWNVG